MQGKMVQTARNARAEYWGVSGAYVGSAACGAADRMFCP